MVDASKLETSPDRYFLIQLRNQLWRDYSLGKGHASVMVGAGFSRSADPAGLGHAKFPSWLEITQRLFDAVYPPSSAGVADRHRREIEPMLGATSTALRLAQEYAVAHTRGALDQLLRSLIPDDRFAPSELHKRLMRLNWVDVFTTNYDTLLERAANDRQVWYERRYTAVRTQDMIADAPRPRIVKLHGSFPENGPFILTEDDFRTYPGEFAVFVNTVRQSMLETAFCLVGFSGDDPNFLNWAGWARDRLGDHAPPIYLVGLLHLPQPRRDLLIQRGIRPIDLDPLIDEQGEVDPEFGTGGLIGA